MRSLRAALTWAILASAALTAGCKSSVAVSDEAALEAMRRGVPLSASDLQAADAPAKPRRRKPKGSNAAADTSNAAAAPALDAPRPVPVALADDPALVLGTFPLDYSKKHPIIDGDTIRVLGLSSTLRLIGIDTEETFKNDKDRDAAEVDFNAYAAAKRGKARFPAKYATPMGEEAAEWGRAWFAGVTDVRLEYDETRRTIDLFGRHLVYVLAQKNGQWLNYNIECVRAGMSPYFMKYGYAARYHKEFADAQAEARAAQRGIWADDVEQYPDYPERLTWWTRRADALQRFQSNYAAQPDAFDLSSPQEWARLKAAEGQTVTVFGSLGDSRLDKGAPFIAYLPHDRTQKLGIVAFERAALDALNLNQYEGEYLYVRGKLSLYKGSPQILAADIERIWTE
jgi:endonuclease YncB( thermonuclease family)